ncbi:transcriptional activator hap3 [Saxophila tyrrhenica]|uniref:Transcriptional activator hap3 n=1 Tax=Saxophila tyrrhenica TaxID=1690608 RepID=A0AAV9PHF5_9PEZI|nr:transcriptional activator hap3 [Saxophila tyrrhenica]
MASPAQSSHEPEDLEAAVPSPEDNEQTQPGGDATTMSRDDPAYDFEVKEQDRWLPIANVARIMKMALPDNAKIAKEAKECMQECVSEFISFITSEASEKCQQEKRKTVNGEDILFAMTSLGFENYGEALKIYLARYRENLVARGEQRPGGASTGGNAANPSGYDSGINNPLAHAMDPSVGGTADFAYTYEPPGDH